MYIAYSKNKKLMGCLNPKEKNEIPRKIFPRCANFFPL